MRFILRISAVLVAAVWPVVASAQGPTTHPGTVRIVSTAADALCVGGSGVSPASCTGGIKGGAVVITTLDTGQGANELYDMDQNVLTTSSPTFATVTVTDIRAGDGGLWVRDSLGSEYLRIASGENLSVNRVLTFVLGDANRTLTLGGDYTFNQSVANGAAPILAVTNFTGTLPALNGAALTNLNASALASGTVADARLEAIINVVTEVVSPLFTGNLVGNVTGNASGSAGSVAVGGITGLGTGVATALAINVGTAGAPVVLNGAGGTPASLLLTNATGLPAASVVAGSFGAGSYTVTGALEVVGLTTVSNYAATPGLATRRAGGTLASPTATQANDIIGVFYSGGYGTNQWGYAASGLFGFYASENFTNTANGAYFVIGTTPNGSVTRAEAIRILGNGNVGFGTTGPLSKLSINGGLHVGGDSDAGDNNAIIDGTLAVIGTATAATINATTALQINGTAQQSVASGATPTLTGTNFTGIPETGISDGALLARLAANETVTGSWLFTDRLLVFKAFSGVAGAGPYFGVGNADNSRQWFFQGNASNGFDLWEYNGSAYTVRSTMAAGGAMNYTSTLAWGGGSAISSSNNVALLNAANVFSGANTFGTTGLITITKPATSVAVLQEMIRLALPEATPIDTLAGFGPKIVFANSNNDASTVESGYVGVARENSSDSDYRSYMTFAVATGSTDVTATEVLRLASTGAATFTGAVTAASFSGPLTGNVTGNASGSAGTATGNAGSATVLQTARNIGGVSFNGSAAIVPTIIVVADTTDTTSYCGLWTDATGDLLPKTDAGCTYDAATGIMSLTGLSVGTSNVILGANYLSGDGGDEGMSVDASGNSAFTANVTIAGNVLRAAAIVESNGTPTITSGASGIAGRDYAFSFSGSGSGVDVVIAFGNTWTNAPICTISPADGTQNTDVWVVISTTTTSVTFNSIASSPGGANVICRGY